ncbi:CUB domain protein, partial [Opisthorchis viverrini]
DRSENEVTRNESFYACCSTLSSGNVTSPGYPNAYPNRLRYSWIIVQPLGCIIQLNFSDFLLERNFDFVSVYNVFGDELGNMIDRWSGTELPASVQSTSNALRIHMKTDGSVAHKGFAANYQTRNTKCRINSDRSESYIGPHGYASGYPEKLNLTWHISQPEGCTIRIDFRKFKLCWIWEFSGV